MQHVQTQLVVLHANVTMDIMEVVLLVLVTILFSFVKSNLFNKNKIKNKK